MDQGLGTPDNAMCMSVLELTQPWAVWQLVSLPHLHRAANIQSWSQGIHMPMIIQTVKSLSIQPIMSAPRAMAVLLLDVKCGSGFCQQALGDECWTA